MKNFSCTHGCTFCAFSCLHLLSRGFDLVSRFDELLDLLLVLLVDLVADLQVDLLVDLLSCLGVLLQVDLLLGLEHVEAAAGSESHGDLAVDGHFLG